MCAEMLVRSLLAHSSVELLFTPVVLNVLKLMRYLWLLLKGLVQNQIPYIAIHLKHKHSLLSHSILEQLYILVLFVRVIIFVTTGQ